MFGKSKDAWMSKKKVQLNVTDGDKKSTQFVTVNEFIEMYNKISPLFTATKKLSEELLGHLYTVDPKNEYLLGLGDAMIRIARVKAMEIEDEDKAIDKGLDKVLGKEEEKIPMVTKWILRKKLDNGLWEKVGMVSRENMIEPELARLRMETPGTIFEAEEFKVV